MTSSAKVGRTLLIGSARFQVARIDCTEVRVFTNSLGGEALVSWALWGVTLDDIDRSCRGRLLFNSGGSCGRCRGGLLGSDGRKTSPRTLIGVKLLATLQIRIVHKCIERFRHGQNVDADTNGIGLVQDVGIPHFGITVGCLGGRRFRAHIDNGTGPRVRICEYIATFFSSVEKEVGN